MRGGACILGPPYPGGRSRPRHADIDYTAASRATPAAVGPPCLFRDELCHERAGIGRIDRTIACLAVHHRRAEQPARVAVVVTALEGVVRQRRASLPLYHQI